MKLTPLPSKGSYHPFFTYPLMKGICLLTRGSTSAGVNDRVLAQLLTELDGISKVGLPVIFGLFLANGPSDNIRYLVGSLLLLRRIVRTCWTMHYSDQDALIRRYCPIMPSKSLYLRYCNHVYIRFMLVRQTANRESRSC
jgi:hypothetical protein